MKTPDQWAREFKLHHCIGKKSFAKQINKIQRDVLMDVIEWCRANPNANVGTIAHLALNKGYELL